jgi:molybdopterin-guanine dinucleotide biosynthesis protein MobB
LNIVGIIGASALRERNLVEEIILSLRFDGWTVSTIKRAPDGFDVDQPGKLSYRRREAGCREVLLVGDRRSVLMTELRDESAPSLGQLAARLLPVDIVIAEGFKGAAVPTVEIFVASRHREPRFQSDPNIVAVVTDDAIECAVPRFGLGDVGGLCRFIVQRLGLAAPAKAGT